MSIVTITTNVQFFNSELERFGITGEYVIETSECKSKRELNFVYHFRSGEESRDNLYSWTLSTFSMNEAKYALTANFALQLQSELFQSQAREEALREQLAERSSVEELHTNEF